MIENRTISHSGERIIDSIASRPSRLEIASKIGIRTEWVKKQFAKPLIIGPAEQSNPFITVYAYSKAKRVTPKDLGDEISQEVEIADSLLERGHNVQWKLLTLKHDSFSSNGPKARYHFIKSLAASRYLFSGSKRRSFSQSPFCDVYLEIDKIREVLDDIRTDIKSQEDEQAYQRFEEDVNHSIATSPNADTRGCVYYFDFCNAFNKQSLSHLIKGRKPIEIEAVDINGLANFVSKGVSDWDAFLAFLLDNEFINPADALFRLNTRHLKEIR